MIVHEEWTDQLSDYLDGELSAEERGAVEAHLRGCAPCAAVLNDLKRVVALAESVEARPPHANLWAGIADRIDAGGAAARRERVMPFARPDSRRVAFTLPQLAAAATLLMAVSGGIAWKVALRSPEGLRHMAPAPASVSVPASASASAFERDVAQSGRDVAQGFSPAFDGDLVAISMADAQYDAAVADLEKAVKTGRGHLDASTVAIVEHNLQIIDQAINQAREALVTDPANSYLSGHLVEARRRKLSLLRRATALATDTN